MHPDVARRQEHPLAPPKPADFAAHEKDRSIPRRRKTSPAAPRVARGASTMRCRNDHDDDEKNMSKILTTNET